MTVVSRVAVACGVVALVASGAVQASGADSATVGDLVRAVAARHGVPASQVKSALEAKGRRIADEDALTREWAARILSDLGVPLTAGRDARLSASDLSRLGPVIALTRVAQAEDNSSGPDDRSGRQPGEVVNQGRKTRAGGRLPDSNADVNAFETLRDDARY